MKRSQLILISGLASLAMSLMVVQMQSKLSSTVLLPVQSTAVLPSSVSVANQPALLEMITPSPAVQVSPSPITSNHLIEAFPEPSLSASPTNEQTSLAIDPSYQAHRITTCNGMPASANFRGVPSFASSALIGAVRHGEIVYLTGKIALGDGVKWYEVVATTLSPMQDQVAPNQIGWIASCFVGG